MDAFVFKNVSLMSFLFYPRIFIIFRGLEMALANREVLEQIMSDLIIESRYL